MSSLETMGWYAVDEQRSPEPHRGELGEGRPELARDLAESGAAHADGEDPEQQSRRGEGTDGRTPRARSSFVTRWRRNAP